MDDNNRRNPAEVAGAVELRHRVRVPDERHHLRPRRQQVLHDPRADEARGAGNENAAIAETGS